jgi:Na+/pantothenate symporter
MYVIAGAIITALIALRPPGGIVTLTSFSGSLYAACFLPAILLGLHWRRGNSFAVCSSMVAGAVVLFLWPFLPFSGSIHRVFPAMLLSTVLYLFFTQIRENTADERVDTLFAHSSS